MVTILFFLWEMQMKKMMMMLGLLLSSWYWGSKLLVILTIKVAVKEKKDRVNSRKEKIKVW